MSLEVPWRRSTHPRRRRWRGDKRSNLPKAKLLPKTVVGGMGGEADDATTTAQPYRSWDHTEFLMRLDTVLITHAVRQKVESHLSLDAL